MNEEAVEVDELAEVEAVGEDKFRVGVGEGDVGGVKGVGELDVEAVVGQGRGGGGEGWDDADHLEERGAVVACHAGGGIHGLEELQEDSGRESRH